MEKVYENSKGFYILSLIRNKTKREVKENYQATGNWVASKDIVMGRFVPHHRQLKKR